MSRFEDGGVSFGKNPNDSDRYYKWFMRIDGNRIPVNKADLLVLKREINGFLRKQESV